MKRFLLSLLAVVSLGSLGSLGCSVKTPKTDAHQANDAAVYIEASAYGIQAWSGSGSFIRKDVVVTAGHVCDASMDYLIKTDDGGEMGAVVAVDMDQVDVCLLKTTALAPHVVPLADSSRMGLGDKVWFIGYPSGAIAYGEGKYVGYVPAGETREREGVVRVSVTMTGWFGASGSAVFNGAGEVIGVISETPTENGMVLWLAPVEDIKRALWTMEK